jgi:hypothetical protein
VKGNLLRTGYFILSVLILCLPALYNRYPLVFSDSGTYMLSSFKLIPPPDRPVGYGLFIRMVTWQATMWTVILFQALIGSFLLFRIIRTLIPRGKIYLIHFVTLCILSLCSSLPWLCSQIMPDIFAGYMILIIFLFLYDRTANKVILALYLLLFGFCIIPHYSNFLISLALLFFCIAIHLMWYRKKSSRTFLVRNGILLLSWFISIQFVLCYNYAYTKRYKLSSCSNVFMAARLSETGLLKTYLQEHCKPEFSPLCRYKDSVFFCQGDFLWNQNSPFNRSRLGFIKADSAYAPLIHAFLTDPKYLKPFIVNCFQAAWQQLFHDQTGGWFIVYGQNSAPWIQIQGHLQRELKPYLGSRQNTGKLDFHLQNQLEYFGKLCALLALLFLFVRRRIQTQTGTLILLVIGGIALNALVTASLAAIDERYGSRVSWLIAFIAILAIADSLNASPKKTSGIPSESKAG